MKKIYNLSLALVSMLTFMNWSSAQCPNNNSPYGSVGNLSAGQSAVVYCMYGGEYATVNVSNNATYVFSTCGGGSWDTQLTLYSSNGTYLSYNDDACGLQSEITWTSNFNGQVLVMLDRYYCSSYSSCMNLTVSRQGNQPQANPCQNIVDVSCNVSNAFNLGSGNGAWNPSGPWGTPGKEQVYSFTASNTGVHQINMTHSSGGWVDLFIKSGSGNCNQNGWTYIDDVLSSATNYVTLTAGQTYHFLIDDENTSASSGTFQIICPNPAQDPCNSITELTCDVSENITIGAGTGAWNPSGPWGTPGKEQVFEYTPTISGSYDILVTNAGGYYLDLFYKTGSCGAQGWTYVDDIYSAATNTLTLTAGTTYYFLIDDEDNAANTGSITISCPCIGNTIDQSVSVSGNTTYFNNTAGACDDCGLRPSEDITYEISIPCAGTYTFETCGLASWDTYLYLSSSPCSGVLAYNDDNCGLQSSITYSFTGAGTYYVTVEGFSSISSGSFGLMVTKLCDLTATLNASEYNCGYNISCNGANDGALSAFANGCGTMHYAWSNGDTGETVGSLGAGTYSVVVTDSWGCSATASATLSEPNPLIANAGNDETVYYGYTPYSCADLSGAAAGGCADYTYSWSADGNIVGNTEDITACPEVTTDYILTVTDLNGCTATDNVTICAIDVRCYAGNSGIQKVEICHVPPGNPGNAHTICVDESAVATHLAHGCSLGSCDEANDCDATMRTVPSDMSTIHDNHGIEFEVIPVPFDNSISVAFEAINAGEYQLNLIDTYGRISQVLYEGEIMSGTVLETIEVQTSESGVYFVQLVDSDQQTLLIKKVIKL